jgi:hypothetical protein
MIIRPEDMHIMANIFLPKDGFNNIERISHLVLTRTGLYIIDSQLLSSGRIRFSLTNLSRIPINLMSVTYSL